MSAGGTLYSDEREMLDAERDYWQPRVAVHFGARLLKWALFDFGQGIPRVLVALNPTARKQTLRARHACVCRQRGVLPLPARRGQTAADGRLAAAYRRRTPRLHARVRQLAHDAGGATDLLIAPPLRPRVGAPVPKIYSKDSRARRARSPMSSFQRLSVLQTTPATWSPSVSGRYPAYRAAAQFAGTSRAARRAR